MNKLKIKKIQFFIKDNWIILITLFVFLIMVLLVNYSISAYQIARNEELKLTNELKILKNRTDIIKANTQLKADQMRIYNKILSTLIPESEDVFNIIYAIEKISMETGFIITNYTVNVSYSSQNKISLNVGGKGDVNTFLEFLKKYNYVGARLATSETIQFSGKNVDTQVNLNFYNKKFTPDQHDMPQLTAKDIEMVEKIKEKVKINFDDDDTVIDTDYDITNNPFE